MSQIIEADDASFDAQVLSSNQPVLVDFSAAWCGPCRKLEPVVREIASAYEGRLKVVKVDVDRAPGAAARFAVLSVPTLILFRDGMVKDQMLGVISKATLAGRVEKVL